MPEEFKHLSPSEQQKLIKKKAFGMMGFALSLILIFSDPMVEVMSNVGERVGVPPFYVAFVLAPIASIVSPQQPAHAIRRPFLSSATAAGTAE